MPLIRQAEKAGCPRCSLLVRCISIIYPDSDLDDPSSRHHLLSVNMFTLPGTPLCSIFMVRVGRTTPERYGTYYLPILSYWLGTCLHFHEECANPNSCLPSRVLDIGASPLDPIRLYITAKEHGRYIALSHCWGKGGLTQARTTRKNIDCRTRSISEEELPMNFLEAIQITRELGLRYLWYSITSTSFRASG
jgi:hypothetical protein